MEVPSNLALKRVGSIWVAYLVIGFGAVALGSAFMRNYAELLVTRVFLALAEGGTLVSSRLRWVLTLGKLIILGMNRQPSCIPLLG